MKVVLCFVFIISLICGGCASYNSSVPIERNTITPNESVSKLPTKPGIQETRTVSITRISNVIADIIAHPDQYADRQVEIVGYYRGWDLLKEVQGTPPVTRSDWVIADNSGAIYVTGGAPQNLDPASPQDAQKVIRLMAAVEQNENGVYLRGIAVEVISTE